MMEKRCINVYIEDGQVCVCNEKGEEFFAMEKVTVVQDWHTTGKESPKEGVAHVTFTLFANLFDSKDLMMKKINE